VKKRVSFAPYERREQMNSDSMIEKVYEDVKVNVKIKLSALWVGLMFFYIYADLLAFYTPGHIEDVMSGEIVGIQINQLFLLGAAVLMAIPSIMVFLSLTLKPKANRWTNIILGIFHAAVLLTTNFLMPVDTVETAETYAYHIFYVGIEAVFIVLIISFAWRWPKPEV
jgi:hypothetical protein